MEAQIPTYNVTASQGTFSNASGYFGLVPPQRKHRANDPPACSNVLRVMDRNALIGSPEAENNMIIGGYLTPPGPPMNANMACARL